MHEGEGLRTAFEALVATAAPERRDAVCAQCHLSGEARVKRDSATVTFVRAGTPGMQVTSHVENLAQSRCKTAAGDRLWCGTCHDPHVPPNAAEIRKQCAGCHAAGSCKGTRDGAGDCLACHMPKS